MNRRRVDQHLRNKFNDFLESITDEDLKSKISSDAIITGGSIASLLLGEKPHDYDIYFKTHNTALAVAKHYVKIFNDRRREQGKSDKLEAEVYSNDSGRIRIRIPSAGVLDDDTDDSQYQYFETTEDESAEDYLTETFTDLLEDGDDYPEEALEKVTEKSKTPPYTPIFLSDNAITLSNKIQIVIRFYGSAAEIHKNFDYVHCTNHWTPSGGLVLRKDALLSLLTKDLQYVGSLYPLASVVRMRKFLKKGWNINAGQILKMCYQLSELDLNDFSVLEEQLTGVDTAYFQELLSVIRNERENLKDIDSTYVASLIDKLLK